MTKELVPRGGNHLPATIPELKEYILVGEAKLKAYRLKLRLIKDLNLARGVKDQTEREGREVAEAILWAAARMGEILAKIPKPKLDKTINGSSTGTIGRATTRSLPDGISKRESHEAQKLARYPEAIRQAVREAREKEELPNRREVLKKIAEKEYNEAVDKNKDRPKAKIDLVGEELIYYMKLLKIVTILPAEPPSHLTEEGYTAFKSIWKRIYERGRRFLDEEGSEKKRITA